jgi:hypothetical protein
MKGAAVVANTDVNTKDLCDTCIVFLRRGFYVKEIKRKQYFKCAQCGKNVSLGSVCELTARKGAGLK